MVSVDGSVFIQIINFLLLIWLLNMILYKPIRNILEERRLKIQNLETTVQKCNADAQSSETTYKEGLEAARQKGLDQKNALIQQANEHERSLLSELNQKALKEMEQIKQRIQDDVSKAKTKLAEEIDSFALAIGQKILGRAVA
ncbi:MAG: F-type H+-transporting ATPase subunit b [Candidatus Magnetoglobus multicellularis str. Araruama]|uniref:ATP synthase subunit b n=1 Tax=Candidatus Magnetoglobus multicellularis str. Araruama TaxID=890399 RepID=A0A1V1NSC0_9BACT|nr:MAG: F-type H+-transporting ATPase subunit b [Candidatus Magnetoglobus multicellularis str. Araruama]